MSFETYALVQVWLSMNMLHRDESHKLQAIIARAQNVVTTNLTYQNHSHIWPSDTLFSASSLLISFLDRINEKP